MCCHTWCGPHCFWPWQAVHHGFGGAQRVPGEVAREANESLMIWGMLPCVHLFHPCCTTPCRNSRHLRQQRERPKLSRRAAPNVLCTNTPGRRRSGRGRAAGSRRPPRWCPAGRACLAGATPELGKRIPRHDSRRRRDIGADCAYVCKRSASMTISPLSLGRDSLDGPSATRTHARKNARAVFLGHTLL